MAHMKHVFVGILVLHLYVNAAPNDVGKLEDIAKIDDSKLDTGPGHIEEEQRSVETSRQKRYFNPYGLPQFNPLAYANPGLGDFGIEDPLSEIHRRVQSIANNLRQPPPPIQHVPIFFPILFIPPSDCSCGPTNSQPVEPINPNNNNTAPNVTTRFPEMEDERQNWGIEVNDSNADDGQDYSRPISFEPIKSTLPDIRPAPPVERDTVQGDAADNQQPSLIVSNQPPSVDSSSSRPPSESSTPQSANQPQSSFFNPQVSSLFPQNGFPFGAPSPCDGAILTCCHRPQVTYDCFAIQGCPNFTPFGNPCEYNSILKIIERFQQFYGIRSR